MCVVAAAILAMAAVRSGLVVSRLASRCVFCYIHIIHAELKLPKMFANLCVCVRFGI